MGPQAGQTICGHIRVEAEAEEELGASAFGPVLAATSSEAQGELWLTIVGRKLTPTQVDLSKFMAGANALHDLRHRSLIPTTVVDRESDFAVVGYTATPAAQSLREVIERDGGRDILVRVAIEMARGLTFLHQRGRLHGALAPGSVLLVDGKVRLWQYGLAELCNADRFAERAAKMGGDVVAPEVRHGRGLTKASDVFSWGVLVGGLASGCEGAEALMAIEDGAADFGEQRILKVLVERAVSRSPSDRPGDGLELLEALSQLGGADAKRAQKYFLEAHEDSDPSAPAGTPRAATEEATPKDGVQTTAILAEERARQLERERQRAEIEAKNAMWAKAPPPIPIKPNKSKPPPPPAKPAAPTDLGERKPARPKAAVDTMRPDRGGAASSSTSGRTPKRKPTPKPVGEPAPSDSSAFRPPKADDSVSHLKLDLPEGSRGVRDVGARIGDEDADETSRPQPREVVARAGSASSIASIGDVTRKPGPHGPRGGLMAALIGVMATGLALWATVAAAGAAGGMAGMMGLHEPPPPEPTPGATGGNEEGPAGTKPDVGAEGAGAAEPPSQCPQEMVALGPLPKHDTQYCIEIAEQPGLREPPTTLVNHKEATKTCESLGRRLCTQAEWKAACQGPQEHRYPYGSGHQQDRCNEATAEGMVVDLTRTGARDACKTETGIYDLVGNVSEWVAEGVALGGDATTKNPTCSSHTKLPRKSASAALGFRCCLTLSASAADDASARAKDPADEPAPHAGG